ncbi:MAG TPA: methylmalonyl Co-A mutase-associated GTPase MeaB, partial [Burkholderiaceae bacterium]
MSSNSRIASTDLADRVLRGDPRAVARMLSRAESGDDEARVGLDRLFAHAGRAHVVGITGVPGSGKSTLVARLASAVRRTGRTIAIVAIDPSSPFSGGSI